MLKISSLMTTTLLAVATSCSPALAQQNCAPTEQVEVALYDNYGEVPQNVATSKGNLVRMFANTETGTFTFILSSPQGLSCQLMAGENYNSLEGLEPKGEAY
jgi:hypothetical protein